VILDLARNEVSYAKHKGHEFRFVTPNKLTRYRARSFASKEPETLQWIDDIPERSVLWDIGANVGLYSIYAAKVRNCEVVAFEPSIFNLECLGRNLMLNGVQDRVVICSLPLGLETKVDSIRHTSTQLGGALSTFGESFGFDGEPIDEVFAVRTLGLRLDDVGTFFPLPLPDYIKLDVDGIEHLILQGGSSLLTNLKGILVEINDTFAFQAEQASELLNAAGFLRVSKLRGGKKASGIGKHGRTFNQIWEKKVG